MRAERARRPPDGAPSPTSPGVFLPGPEPNLRRYAALAWHAPRRGRRRRPNIRSAPFFPTTRFTFLRSSFGRANPGSLLFIPGDRCRTPTRGSARLELGVVLGPSAGPQSYPISWSICDVRPATTRGPRCRFPAVRRNASIRASRENLARRECNPNTGGLGGRNAPGRVLPTMVDRWSPPRTVFGRLLFLPR